MIDAHSMSIYCKACTLKTNLKVTDPEKYATWETEHYWGECDSNFNGNILSVKNTCALFCKLSNFTLSKMNSVSGKCDLTLFTPFITDFGVFLHFA